MTLMSNETMNKAPDDHSNKPPNQGEPDQVMRLYDLIDELGEFFDELEPTLKTASPGWWEKHQPIAKIREELDGWLPSRLRKSRRRRRTGTKASEAEG